jgi:SulP family sulfate permease
MLFVLRSARPGMSILGRVGEQEFRDLRRYPDAVTQPWLLILRFEASLYFANAGFVEDRIRELLAQQPEVRWVLLDMSGVNDIDGVAVSMLTELMRDCAAANVQFACAGMKAGVRDIVRRAGWGDLPGDRMFYPNLQQALAALP